MGEYSIIADYVIKCCQDGEINLVFLKLLYFSYVIKKGGRRRQRDVYLAGTDSVTQADLKASLGKILELKCRAELGGKLQYFNYLSSAL
jgi:hypothetical protein